MTGEMSDRAWAARVNNFETVGEIIEFSFSVESDESGLLIQTFREGGQRLEPGGQTWQS